MAPSFGEVYEAHAATVLRALRRLGVREADLEDAAQEVLVVHRRARPAAVGDERPGDRQVARAGRGPRDASPRARSSRSARCWPSRPSSRSVVLRTRGLGRPPSAPGGRRHRTSSASSRWWENELQNSAPLAPLSWHANPGPPLSPPLLRHPRRLCGGLFAGLGSIGSPSTPGVQNPYGGFGSTFGTVGVGLLIGGGAALAAGIPMIAFSGTRLEFFPMSNAPAGPSLKSTVQEI